MSSDGGLFRFDMLPLSEQERIREKTRLLSSEEWHSQDDKTRPFKPDLSRPKLGFDALPDDVRKAIIRNRTRTDEGIRELREFDEYTGLQRPAVAVVPSVSGPVHTGRSGMDRARLKIRG